MIEKSRHQTADSRPIVLRCLLFAVWCLVASAASGQQRPLVPLRLGETLLNLPTARVLPAGAWEVRFTHRFSQPINDGDVHSLWGLDGSADVGLGLAYSPWEKWQVSVYRTDLQDNVEASVKYMAVRQGRFPVAASLRGGIDWRTERDIQHPRSAFAQATLSHQFGQKAEVFLVPTYATNAGLFDYAFNVPIGLAWAIYPHLSLVGELIPENNDLPASVDSSLGWSVGLKRAIGGHFFELQLSNSRATHVNQYISSVLLGQGLEAGDIHLGFNIERRFGTSRR